MQSPNDSTATLEIGASHYHHSNNKHNSKNNYQQNSSSHRHPHHYQRSNSQNNIYGSCVEDYSDLHQQQHYASSQTYSDRGGQRPGGPNLVNKQLVLPFVPPSFPNSSKDGVAHLIKPSEYLKSISDKRSCASSARWVHDIDNLDCKFSLSFYWKSWVQVPVPRKKWFHSKNFTEHTFKYNFNFSLINTW